MNKMNLRQMLKEKIKASGLTQKEISKHTNVTEAKISTYLNGKTELRTDTYERLFNTLNKREIR